MDRWVSGSRTLVAALVVASFLSAPLVGEPVFRLGTVSARAGAAELTVPLEVIPEEAAPVAGWSAVVSYDPAVMSAVAVEKARPADVFGFRTPERHGMPGILIVWALYSLADDPERMLSAEAGGVVANLRFCVLESAKTGTYPITFLLQSPQGDRYRTLATSFEGGYATGVPDVEAGVVAIGGDAAPAGPCVPEAPVPPPPALNGTFELVGGSAVRGLPATVPFTLSADQDVIGFSFSVDFDEEVLEAGVAAQGAAPVQPVYMGHLGDPDGSRHEYEHFEWNNSNETPGSAGVDEGFVTGAVVFDLESRSFFLPPGEDHEVLRLIFYVKPKAPLGPTEVRFEDGAPFLSITQKNAFLAAGSTGYPEFVSATVFIHARLNIIGDVSPFRFIRGDSNLDGKVDIADSVRTFMFLFLGAEAPGCLEAADATDDGTLDISDGIRILSYAFTSSAGIPHPGPRDCGHDLTADELGCRAYPACP
ncbi:MAG: hypothetical protein HY721_10670 [Planctomycetes bacterium]|nr:hypothetical protein [Planctomycetota bacterium]